MNNIQPILLVEDDQVDIMTVKRGFKELGVANEIICACNGEEALALLRESTNKLPCVILLDINMPKMNGLEFLAQIKQHAVFKNIPVIMLTSSVEQQDVDDCFNQGVSGYILKSVEYDQFLMSIRVLNPYWTLS